MALGNKYQGNFQEASHMTQFEVPAGTIILFGHANQQPGDFGPGGASQIYIRVSDRSKLKEGAY